MSADRICQHCGAAFQAKHPDARYCSVGCRSLAFTQRRKARKIAARRKVCPQCGRLFDAKRTDAEVCSNACRQRSYRNRLRKDLNQEPQREPPLQICAPLITVTPPVTDGKGPRRAKVKISLPEDTPDPNWEANIRRAMAGDFGYANEQS